MEKGCRLTKIRHEKTHLGCEVVRVRTLYPDRPDVRVVETIHLSHPRPLSEVAFGRPRKPRSRPAW